MRLLFDHLFWFYVKNSQTYCISYAKWAHQKVPQWNPSNSVHMSLSFHYNYDGKLREGERERELFISKPFWFSFSSFRIPTATTSFLTGPYYTSSFILFKINLSVTDFAILLLHALGKVRWSAAMSSSFQRLSHSRPTRQTVPILAEGHQPPLAQLFKALTWPTQWNLFQVIWLLTYDWKFGDTGCKMYQFLSAFTYYSNSNVVVAIGLDRLKVVYTSHIQGTQNSLNFHGLVLKSHLQSLPNSKQTTLNRKGRVSSDVTLSLFSNKQLQFM